MSNSKLKMNLLFEQVLIESHVHLMFEEILKEEDYKVSEGDKSLIKKVGEDLKLNTSLIFTYGVGMAAFVGPVTELLHNKGFRLTKEEVTLLIITSFYVLLSGSKEDVKKLLSLIKEKKLMKELKSVTDFIEGLFELFKVVAKKVGVVAGNLVDILSFTFISVPVLGMVKKLAYENGITIDDFKSLSAGLTLSIGSYLVKNLLKKRIKESEDNWFTEIEELDPAKKFIYELMYSLKISESKNPPGFMYYKDASGEILMSDDINHPQSSEPTLYVDVVKIWSKLWEMGLGDEQIENLLIQAVKDVFNRKVVSCITWKRSKYHI